MEKSKNQKKTNTLFLSYNNMRITSSQVLHTRPFNFRKNDGNPTSTKPVRATGNCGAPGIYLLADTSCWLPLFRRKPKRWAKQLFASTMSCQSWPTP